MHPIIDEVRQDLKNNVDEKTKNSFQRFFKEKVKYHGVKAGNVTTIARSGFEKIKHLEKDETFDICEELLKSGYGEEAWIAAGWADRKSKDFVKKDIEVFERWIDRYIDDWAKCDTLCNHAIGTLVEKYPVNLNRLKLWTKSANRWKKRASAVSLIIQARKGLFLNDVFEIADKLMTDKDDMVQKGYGWMLKAASQAHQKEVFDYVMKNKSIMPRTALRYAIEKMPENLKHEAMRKP